MGPLFAWGPADLLDPLFVFCKCVAAWCVGALLAGVTALVNLFVAALMALLGPILALLPEVDLAQYDVPGWLAMTNWVLPLDQFVIATGVVATVLVVWHVAAIGLRWLKAVE